MINEIVQCIHLGHDQFM